MSVEWVTFDCYGTLIDWEGGITDALLPLLPPGTDRRALAERYITMEAEFEAEGYHLYRDVLDRVSRRVLRSLDAPIPDDQASPLPSSLAEWQPFSEVRSALRVLVDQGRYLAILSNVDRDLLELSIGRLGVRPDLAITAEDAQSYKPATGHWRRFLERSAFPNEPCPTARPRRTMLPVITAVNTSSRRSATASTDPAAKVRATRRRSRRRSSRTCQPAASSPMTLGRVERSRSTRVGEVSSVSPCRSMKIVRNPSAAAGRMSWY